MPADNLLQRQIAGPVLDVLSRMPEAVAAIQSVAFESLRRATPATTAMIARTSQRTESEIAQALELMTSVGAAIVDEHGRVVGVHGLSVQPTRHELRLDGVALYTWCAVDALGIPVALGAEANIRTPCLQCGTVMELAVREGRVIVDGQPVAWCPTTACTNLADGLCRQINLFCDRDHLDAWRRGAGDPEGLVLSIADIEENGRRVWG